MRLRTSATLLVALATLVAAGCGGDGDSAAEVAADEIAVVDGEAIPRSAYSTLIGQARRGYEQQKRPFPKAGTPEFVQLRNQVVNYLVRRETYEQKADELGVEVTDKQVAGRLTQFKKQRLGGSEKRYREALKAQGYTDAQVREDIRAQLVSEVLFKSVTDGVKVTQADVKAYYEKNKRQYTQPESREVRHILVKQEARATSVYQQLRSGGDFAALAKKFSIDPGSKAQGGKLTISRGQTVPAFDREAFRLQKDALSRPVKTQYGYHVIQALTPVKKTRITPLPQVQAAIRQQLLQTKRNESLETWTKDVDREFREKIAYQPGFKPPPTATTSTGATTTG